MKSLIFLILALFASTSLFAQKWANVIGQPGIDEYSQRVIEHYDKGYLITGGITPVENTHGLLIKTDINGIVLWDKIIGVPDQVLFEKIIYDEEGNLYILGVTTQQIDPLWPMVLKLNPCGELLWCTQLYFDEFMYGFFTDAILLENGDLLGVASMPDEQQYDMIWLFCISPDGEYKWKQSYASKENYPLFEMRLGSRIQFFDDIYIISGYVYSPHPDYPTVSSIK
ncbi:MAG: hypothetical protein FJY07_12685, partial [Bacteroidetes bacterium]|nr:hypothetical protein [Bacteroidota bacterium]